MNTAFVKMTDEERMVSHARSVISTARTSNVRANVAVTAVMDELMKDEKFCTIPSSNGKHHYYKHGNLKHTSEVVCLAMDAVRTANAYRRVGNEKELDEVVVFLSALLHDYGKIYAYELDPEKPGHWRKTKDYRIQLHIEKSIEKATEILDGKVSEETIEAVLHAIGAHHGKIEWGALWLPTTPEAWAVHLADMNSVFVVTSRKDK
jgi:3'-5' exoribonuclease